MRPHLSLDVRNMPDSVEFYLKVFGVEPQKQTANYAKFDLTAPVLNLALVSSTGRVSAVNHLGIEVESVDDIAEWKQRLQEQGILEKVEVGAECCFARQDKLRFTDPDGNPWEVFTVHEQLAVTGPLAQSACCAPKGKGVSEQTTARCDRRAAPYGNERWRCCMEVDAQEIWQQIHNGLRAFIAKRVANEAEVDDIVQDVWLKMQRGLDGLKD